MRLDGIFMVEIEYVSYRDGLYSKPRSAKEIGLALPATMK
jgi:hypothetical protein